MSGESMRTLLAGLAPSDVPPRPPPATCGGALLYVTRETAIQLAERGLRWERDPRHMPREGRHPWRVACSDEVLTVARTADLPDDATPEQRASAPKYHVTYGLCTRCCGHELRMRRRLRELAEQQAEESKYGRGGRRGFREGSDL